MNEKTNAPQKPEEPDWSFPMFWEDITFVLQKIFAFIKSLFVPPTQNH